MTTRNREVRLAGVNLTRNGLNSPVERPILNPRDADYRSRWHDMAPLV
jgi:hypothetical protein